eukprot:tig00020904_g15203.t1
MRGLLHRFLRRWCKVFMKNVDSHQIDLAFLRGDKSLHEVELIPECVEEFVNLPQFRVLHAKCTRISIDIPWTSITSKPIVLAIDHMHVHVAEPQEMQPVPDVMAKAFSGKTAVTMEDYLKKRKTGFHVKIQENVHVQIADMQISVEMLPLTLGVPAPILHIAIDRVLTYTTDPQWEVADIDKTYLKDPISKEKFHHRKNLLEKMTLSLIPERGQRFVLVQNLPVTVKMVKTIDINTGRSKAFTTGVWLGSIESTLTHDEWGHFFHFSTALARCFLRPMPKRNPQPDLSGVLALSAQGRRSSSAKRTQWDKLKGKLGHKKHSTHDIRHTPEGHLEYVVDPQTAAASSRPSSGDSDSSSDDEGSSQRGPEEEEDEIRQMDPHPSKGSPRIVSSIVIDAWAVRIRRRDVPAAAPSSELDAEFAAAGFRHAPACLFAGRGFRLDAEMEPTGVLAHLRGSARPTPRASVSGAAPSPVPSPSAYFSYPSPSPRTGSGSGSGSGGGGGGGGVLDPFTAPVARVGSGASSRPSHRRSRSGSSSASATSEESGGSRPGTPETSFYGGYGPGGAPGSKIRALAVELAIDECCMDLLPMYANEAPSRLFQPLRSRPNSYPFLRVTFHNSSKMSQWGPVRDVSVHLAHLQVFGDPRAWLTVGELLSETVPPEVLPSHRPHDPLEMLKSATPPPPVPSPNRPPRPSTSPFVSFFTGGSSSTRPATPEAPPPPDPHAPKPARYAIHVSPVVLVLPQSTPPSSPGIHLEVSAERLLVEYVVLDVHKGPSEFPYEYFNASVFAAGGVPEQGGRPREGAFFSTAVPLVPEGFPEPDCSSFRFRAWGVGALVTHGPESSPAISGRHSAPEIHVEAILRDWTRTPVPAGPERHAHNQVHVYLSDMALEMPLPHFAAALDVVPMYLHLLSTGTAFARARLLPRFLAPPQAALHGGEHLGTIVEEREGAGGQGGGGARGPGPAAGAHGRPHGHHGPHRHGWTARESVEKWLSQLKFGLESIGRDKERGAASRTPPPPAAPPTVKRRRPPLADSMQVAFYARRVQLEVMCPSVEDPGASSSSGPGRPPSPQGLRRAGSIAPGGFPQSALFSFAPLEVRFESEKGQGKLLRAAARQAEASLDARARDDLLPESPSHSYALDLTYRVKPPSGQPLSPMSPGPSPARAGARAERALQALFSRIIVHYHPRILAQLQTALRCWKSRPTLPHLKHKGTGLDFDVDVAVSECDVVWYEEVPVPPPPPGHPAPLERRRITVHLPGLVHRARGESHSVVTVVASAFDDLASSRGSARGEEGDGVAGDLLRRLGRALSGRRNSIAEIPAPPTPRAAPFTVAPGTPRALAASGGAPPPQQLLQQQRPPESPGAGALADPSGELSRLRAEAARARADKQEYFKRLAYAESELNKTRAELDAMRADRDEAFHRIADAQLALDALLQESRGDTSGLLELRSRLTPLARRIITGGVGGGGGGGGASARKPPSPVIYASGVGGAGPASEQSPADSPASSLRVLPSPSAFGPARGAPGRVLGMAGSASNSGGSTPRGQHSGRGIDLDGLDGVHRVSLPRRSLQPGGTPEPVPRGSMSFWSPSLGTRPSES